eukprot:TRINITY_DN1214_c0_g5_i1.p1 TRINITY_DN1214_c0_g5~~TRINITY_DN1214_c0_g5_i1.p1  ORF type:complete len:909 (-),score=152.89 TRINITY_DN1214_c0_g5_i1:88-2814(-)
MATWIPSSREELCARCAQPLFTVLVLAVHLSWPVARADVALEATSSLGEPRGRLVRISGDEPSFLRVRAPKGASAFRLDIEAARPVAAMAAYGYFPSEAHFDVSNFRAWAAGRPRSSLEISIDELASSPCGAEDGHLSRCIERAAAGPGLRCGEAEAPASASPAAAHAGDRRLQTVPMCGKYVDACHHGRCSENRGPAFCSNASIVGGSGVEGDCLCQRGYCEASGRCVGADLLQQGCMKITGEACPFATCSVGSGSTVCEDGLCVCSPGHCSIGGVCRPGPMCGEFEPPESCQSGGPRLVQQPDRRLAGAGDQDGEEASCCRRLDTARAVSPAAFARCTARRFFSLKDAAARGVEVPLLRLPGQRLEEPDAEAREVVVSLRAAERSGGISARLDNEVDVVDVRLSLVPLDGVGASDPDRLERFDVLEELLAPSWLGKHLAPRLRQMEAPLLQPLAGPDVAAKEAPPSALKLDVRPGHPVLVRLAEEGFSAHPGGGVLRLHLIGLPEGSQVLYSLSWPEPRSLMDFGHAELVNADARRLSSVWTAPRFNVRHFALMPSEHGEVTAFFAVHPMASGADGSSRLAERLPPQSAWFAASAKAQAVPKEAAGVIAGSTVVQEGEGEQVHTPFGSALVFLACLLGVAVLGIAVLVQCMHLWEEPWVKWLLRFVPGRRHGSESIAYTSVAVSDDFLTAEGAPGASNVCAIAASAGWSSGDELDQLEIEGRARGATSFRSGSHGLAGAFWSLADAAKEQFSNRFPFSATTRASGTRRSWDWAPSTRRSAATADDEDLLLDCSGDRDCGPHSEEEAHGLLSGVGQDISAQAASERRSSSESSSWRDSRSRSRESPRGGVNGCPLLDTGTLPDDDAMAALIALRPAAGDSVGDGLGDDDDVSCSPLVGSERARYLGR